MNKEKIIELLDECEFGTGTYESRLYLLDEIRKIIGA